MKILLGRAALLVLARKFGIWFECLLKCYAIGDADNNFCSIYVVHHKCIFKVSAPIQVHPQKSMKPPSKIFGVTHSFRSYGTNSFKHAEHR